MAADPNDISGQIQTAATQPAEVQTDNLHSKAQPLKDQIEVDAYLKANAAAANARGFGVRIGRIRNARQCQIRGGGLDGPYGFPGWWS